MEKKLFFVLSLSILLFLTGFFVLQRKPASLRQERITIHNHTFIVEIADTDRSREKGLSGRKNLPPNSGMLFLFPQKEIYSFWMKDMLFPLDFIWIEGNTIVDLTENVSPPTPSTILSFYNPKKPVDKVLEVAAGTIDSLGIKVSEKIIL